MRILVTGGRGLLGGGVVRELVTRGHTITTLQRTSAGPGADVAELLGDIRNADVVRRAVAGQEAVVHLAARVSMVGSWSQFEDVNVRATKDLLAAARAAGVRRFVQVSSPSVAHSGAPLVGVGAEPADPTTARGNYARSKAMAELAALSAEGPDFAVCAIRPHLVWGPGDEQLVARIAQRARSGRLVLIDHGLALIDTTYVDNAADAIAQAVQRCELEQVRGRAFVVSNGEPRTVAEVLGRIAQAAGAQPPTRSVPFAVARAAGAAVERVWVRAHRSDEPPMTAFVAEQLATAHWFDQRSTRAALDWRPRVSLDEGFERLRASYAAA